MYIIRSTNVWNKGRSYFKIQICINNNRFGLDISKSYSAYLLHLRVMMIWWDICFHLISIKPKKGVRDD